MAWRRPLALARTPGWQRRRELRWRGSGICASSAREPRLRIALERPVGFRGLGLALVLEDAIHVFLPVERHADLPCAREHFRILHGDLVAERVGVLEREPFLELQLFAMEVAGAVEPRLVVVVGHGDDQRVAFPAPARVAHPEIDTLN